MPNRCHRVRGWAIVALVMLVMVVTLGLTRHAPLSGAQPPAGDTPETGFTTHVIDDDLTGGYQVVITDLNRDGKPDIMALATGLKELRWYQNPSWTKHVLVSGINRPINAAAHDVDGDGMPEIALAHEFSSVYANSAGIVSILTHHGDPKEPWTIKEIDRLPTSHRVRFADITGRGQKVLVNFPLIGSRALAPDYRDRVSLVMYRPGDWKREVITDADAGVVHGILTTPWDSGRRDASLSASFLGVHAHRFDKGRWTRTEIVKGDPSEWPKSGASDVTVGRVGRDRFLATIEPWHGNTVAIYRHDTGAWTRHVIDQGIADGHTIVAGDFDGDGRDEVVVGERQGQRSTYLYRITNVKANTWSKVPLDAGGMSAAGCALADLNADKTLDVVCIGSATANLKWYENRHGSRSTRKAERGADRDSHDGTRLPR